MLPASELTETLANLSALDLQPNITAQILAAVLAPLPRSADPAPPAAPLEASAPRAPARTSHVQHRRR
jgi:hypothetical protein